MNNSFDCLLKSLNPNQLSAVKAPIGPLLVLAGAGSGKTQVLTCRFVYFILKNKIPPTNILAITFTNKAAREMQERVYTLIQNLNVPVHGRLWISTFHSLCARILRDNKKLLNAGGGGVFTIYDTSDQLSLVKKILKDFNIDEQSYHPKSLLSHIAYCKRQAIDPDAVETMEFRYFRDRFQDLYDRYELELAKAGAYDFEGLLFETHKFFLKYPEYLEKYRKQFLHIFVDEYQDTNQIQYRIVKQLAQKHQSICVVGDEDQSIYSWRGADVSNILNFDKDFPNCKVIKLEQNYRSTKTIISAASSLVQNNQLRKQKKLFTNNSDGCLIQVYELKDEYREARMIADLIEDYCVNRGYAYEDFAIFYRTNAQSRVLEDALRAKGITYKVAGGLKFYERMEIKDILAYLNFILNTKDEVSLKRIINTPRRGIGRMAIDKINQRAHLLQKSFFSTMEYIAKTNELSGSTRVSMVNFVSMIQSLKTKINSMSLSDFYKEVLEQTGYMKQLKENNSVEAMARLDNLQELANVIAQFEVEQKSSDLEDFLETMALLTPTDQVSSEDKSVTLMTLHISKGLEFNMVFMAGMEEGLFPVSHSIRQEELEEERRLAYVGITRAKKNLVMSYAKTRHKFGVLQHNYPSQFLEEIPAEFIQFTSLDYFKKMHKVRL